MRHLKFSTAHVSIILAVLAIDMAVVRSLSRFKPGSNQTLYVVPIDATHFLPFLTIALGVLPMASLLVPAAPFQALRVRITGTASPAWLGFVTFGWISLFLFMSLASLSPPAIQRYLLGIGEWIGPAIMPLVGDAPIIRGTSRYWLVESIEFAVCVVAFSLPQLAVAMAGGLFIGRSRAVEPSVLRETPDSLGTCVRAGDRLASRCIELCPRRAKSVRSRVAPAARWAPLQVGRRRR